MKPFFLFLIIGVVLVFVIFMIQEDKHNNLLDSERECSQRYGDSISFAYENKYKSTVGITPVIISSYDSFRINECDF